MDKTMQTYEFISSYIDSYGYPPTIREICVNVKLDSTSSVAYHLKKLEKMGKISISENFFMGSNLFVLEVKGDSMIDIGILNGDYVVISKQSVANNGEIVACLIDNEATVKRFYKEDGHFRLQPENDDYEPIIVDSVEILGKVVSVMRSYD